MTGPSLSERLRAADYRGVATDAPATDPSGAMARLVLGRSAEVTGVAERQLARARAEGDAQGVCRWLEVLAHVRWLQGRSSASSACSRELLRVSGRGTSREVVARLLLGRSLGQSLDAHSWRRHAERALEVARALGDAWLVGQSQLALGIVSIGRGEEPRTWLAKAAESFAGRPYWEARCEVPLPMVLGESPEVAQRRFARLITTFEGFGDRPTQAICLVGRARQLRLLERLDEALACSVAAERVGYPAQQVLARYGQARVYALRRQFEQADELYRELLADPELPASARSMMRVPGMAEAARRGDVEAFSRRMLAITHARALSQDLWEVFDECVDAGLPRPELLQLAALAYDGSAPAQRGERADILRELSRGDLPIGPFRLTGEVGRGGMATVWRAIDRRSPDEAVAVKILRIPDGVSGHELAERFRRELRALAALEHPNIQSVWDYGETGLALELLSDGQIPAGSPGLSMPLAEGGTLRPWCGRMGWPDVREVLLQLLDGLAVAHAHSVLHLDLKPENVLLASPRPPFHARLADFGLARAIGEMGVGALVGTPAYMAPEQFRGDVRAWGPATDLYAFGCLGWAMVTGRSPFRGPVAALRSQHLSAPRPRLEAAVDVPVGLEAWLWRLLHRSPEGRFVDAAAAARALRRLGPAVPFAAVSAPAEPAAVDDTFAFELDDPTDEVEVRAEATVTDDGATVPAQWPPPPPPPPFSEALVGLRSVPVVGRRPVQDLLWQALREAADGTPRAVALVAEPGMGAGRLVHWLTHEVRRGGLGEVLWARMAAAPARGLGLHGLAQDALHTRGLQGEELAAWLHRSPWRPPAVSVPMALAAHEADQVPERMLPLVSGFAAMRPVVLCLEAVQHLPGLDAVVGTLLRSTLPVLVVMTADARVGAARRARWADAGVVQHVLGRLDDASGRALADALLPVVREQREQLLAACGGHPGRLVRVLKRVSAQGLAVDDGEGRYRVPELTLLDLEDGLDVSLPPLPAGASEVVFAVAVLGGDVPRDEVHDLLAVRGSAWVDCEEVSSRDGIVRVAAWLAAAALRHLEELDELQAWHRDAARALVGGGGLQALRRGRHHVQAGEADAGAAALREACRGLDSLMAATVYPEWEAALHAAGVSADDPRWLDGWAAWLHSRIAAGYREADATLRARAQAVVASGDATQRAVARLAVASMGPSHEVAQLAALWEEVAADEAVAADVRGQASLQLAYLALHQGRAEEALGRAHAATDGLVAEHPLRAAAMQLMGKVHQQAGRYDEAEHWLRASLAHGEGHGTSGRSQVHAWAVLGDVQRDRGDLDEAERSYQQARSLSRAYVDEHRFLDELNLVLLDARRGRLADHAERLPVLERCLRRIAGPYAVFPKVLSLALPTRLGHTTRVLADVEEALAPSGWCDAELASTAELVADLVGAQGRHDEQRALLALAAMQWEAVGRPEDAERVRASAGRGGAGPAS